MAPSSALRLPGTCLACRRQMGRKRLPARPLALALWRGFKEFGDRNSVSNAKRPGVRRPGWASFATYLDEHDRTIRRIASAWYTLAPPQTVQLDTADRLCVKLGIQLEEVYPL